MRILHETFSILRRSIAAVLVGVLGVWLAISVQAEIEHGGSKTPGVLEFVGNNIFSTANGVFHEWRVVDFSLDLDADADTIASSFAQIEVSLASLDTQNTRRDEHLRTADFFDVDKYPLATARGHSLVAAGESEAGNRLFELQFDLDLHGVQRTLPGVVEIVSAEPMVAEGRLVLDRLEFGVGPPASRWNPMSIETEIPIRFRIEF